MIKMICRICKKEFYVIKSRKQKAKYCSRKCYGIKMKSEGNIFFERIKDKKHTFIKGNRYWNNPNSKSCWFKNKYPFYLRIWIKFKRYFRKDLRKLKKFREQKIGSNNPNWKGGKMRHRKGYILILNPSHPFAGKSGYILEHRFVMEQHIGRYLKKEEIVHHKNSIRSDNRIENLTLTTKNKNRHSQICPKCNFEFSIG